MARATAARLRWKESLGLKEQFKGVVPENYKIAIDAIVAKMQAGGESGRIGQTSKEDEQGERRDGRSTELDSNRKGDDAQGDPAPRAVPDDLLLLRAARPRQRRLRRAADEQGSRADAGDVRLCREPVLRLLFPGRGAEQPGPAEGRCQALDRPHHDHLGIGDGVHGVRGGTVLALRDALHPRRGGGRFLSRRDPLSDLLAAVPVPRAHPGDVHRFHPARHLPGFAAFGRPARARRRAWSARVAVAVHPGRAADRPAGRRLPVRSHGQAGAGDLADARSSGNG